MSAVGSVPEPFLVLRRDAARLLGGWAAPSSALEELRQEMVRHLECHPGSMWREGGPVHFTTGLVLLDPDLTHVALTLHRKAKRWFQFGGHFEADDVSVLAAAEREGREESGLESLQLLPELIHADTHDLPGAFGRCERHLDLRFAGVAHEGMLSISDESDDVRWWPLEALPPGTETELRQAVLLACAALSGVV